MEVMVTISKFQGLAISYRIIQSHNSEIDVESDVGKGSTFRIKLPVEKKDGELGRFGEGQKV